MKLEALLHKVYGTTPNDGNLQPKEAVAYAVAGFGQNFICTIIGSYLTIFMTDALLFGSANVMIGSVSGAMAVAYLMLGTRILMRATIRSWARSWTKRAPNSENAVRI